MGEPRKAEGGEEKTERPPAGTLLAGRGRRLTPASLLADEDVCVFKCSVSRETECSRVGKQSFIITLGCNSVLIQFATPNGTCPPVPVARTVPSARGLGSGPRLLGAWRSVKSQAAPLSQRRLCCRSESHSHVEVCPGQSTFSMPGTNALEPPSLAPLALSGLSL